MRLPSFARTIARPAPAPRIVYSAGFEANNTSELWFGNSSASVSSATARSGTYSYLVPSSAAYGTGFGSANALGLAECYVRVYFRTQVTDVTAQTWIPIFILSDAASSAILKCVLRQETDDTCTLSIHGLADVQLTLVSPLSITLGSWHRLEAHIARGNPGVVEVRLDDVPIFSGTPNLGMNNIDNMIHGYGGAGVAHGLYFDDIAVATNTWVGAVAESRPPFVPSDWIPFAAMTDEFNGSALDSTKWWAYDARDDGSVIWQGRAPALFHPGNVSVSDGKLKLAMTPDGGPNNGSTYHTYRASLAKSKTRRVAPLAIQVSAKIGTSHSSSAIWMYENNGTTKWTEIDILEAAGKSQSPGTEHEKVFTNIHNWNPGPHDEHAHWYPNSGNHGGSLQNSFHTYGLLWQADSISFYFDNVLLRTISSTTYMDQALPLIFDREIFPGWFGTPNVADLPDVLEIEYARAWVPAG